MSDHPDSNKCLLRVAINIVFVKSTLFKSRINTKTLEGMKENIESWVKLAKDLGFFERRSIRPSKIADNL